jgi:hypothetical protein
MANYTIEPIDQGRANAWRLTPRGEELLRAGRTSSLTTTTKESSR